MTGLFFYGFSLPGRSHTEVGVPCQDAHIVHPLSGGWMLAAVADGLGSAAQSRQGAALAVATLADTCAGGFAVAQPDTLTTLLEDGFGAALAALESAATAAGLPLREFDTTLTAALYNGEQVVWGHCGDGGILALEPDGRYRLLTTVQKGDSWNQVVPLRLGREYWVFHQEQTPADGLLLLTDGLFDVAVPPLLACEESLIYAPFTHRFLRAGLDAVPAAETVAELTAFIQSDACAAITDDVTAVALLCDRPVSPPPSQYLSEPDWEALRLARYYKLYPHLLPQAEEDLPDDSGEPQE